MSKVNKNTSVSEQLDDGYMRNGLPARHAGRRWPLASLTLLAALAQTSAATAQDALDDDLDAEIRAMEAEEEKREREADPGAASEKAEDAAEEKAQEEASEAKSPEAKPIAPAPESAPPVATDVQAPDDDMEEMVVTVDRRRKSLQDYSGVASAFNQEQLDRLGVFGVGNLATMSPGLQIGNQEGNTEIYIRGVGSDNNTELGDPAVALHIDGVYIPRPRGVGSMFFDIKRVEVNSGPQGTLRGRNALGGAVNIIPEHPKLGEYEAYAEIGIGNFDARTFKGMFNIPLGEKVAFRVAAFSDRHAAHWTNGGFIWDIEPAESADSYAVRASVKIQPTDKFTIDVSYDFLKEGGTGYLGANYNDVLNLGLDPWNRDHVPNARSVYLRGHQPNADLFHQGGKLALSLDTDFANFQFIGGVRDLGYEQNTGTNAGVIYNAVPELGVEDQNISAVNQNFGSSYWETESTSYTAELRASAPEDSRLNWVGGLFGFFEDQKAFLAQTAEPAATWTGGEFNMPDITGQSLAAYFDATYNVTDDLRVIGGVRYTTENKRRMNGLWALYAGLEPIRPEGYETPEGGSETFRYGTEGFRWKGYDRTIYSPEDTEALRNGGGTPEAARAAAVELWLDGIERHGVNDTVLEHLCAQPPADSPEGIATNGRWLTEQQDLLNEQGQCKFGVNTDNVTADSPNINIGQMVPQNNERSFTFFDWRAGVEYDITEDNLLYFTVTTGHKSGGFNDTASGDAASATLAFSQGLQPAFANSEFRPENITAFELGSKNQFFNRKFTANVSLFFYQYNDQVFQTLLPNAEVAEDPITGEPAAIPTSAFRQNAATSRILGADIFLRAKLPYRLNAEVNALLLDARFGNAEISETRVGFGSDVIYDVNLEGNFLPRAPRFTVNYSLSQIVFTDAGSFDWIVSAQTKGEHFMTVYNGDGTSASLLDPVDPARQDILNRRGDYIAVRNNPARLNDQVRAYTYVNLGGGWKHPEGHFGVSVYANNLLNAEYITSTIITPTLNLRFFNPPRTFGARLRVNW